jgi:hypothetical protein
MGRRFATSVFITALVALGCSTADTPPSGPASAEAGGSASPPEGGGSAGDAAPPVDATGPVETGGGSSGGSGEAASEGDETNVNEDASTDATLADDAMPTDADLSESGIFTNGPFGDASVGYGLPIVPGKPWNYICPKTWTHQQCCALLCACLQQACADSPMDKPGTNACPTTCPMLSDMAMRCHVFHCSESTNPTNPKDHVSHCGHASGRVPGGMCPPVVYQ